MRISDWSSDVCSSALSGTFVQLGKGGRRLALPAITPGGARQSMAQLHDHNSRCTWSIRVATSADTSRGRSELTSGRSRSEEHTSELQSLMRISYAVFCLKKKKQYTYTQQRTNISQYPNESEQHIK